MAQEYSPLFAAQYKNDKKPFPVFQKWIFGGESRSINLQQGDSETSIDFATRLQTKLQTELPLFASVVSVVTPPTVTTFTDVKEFYYIISTFEVILVTPLIIPTDSVLDWKDKDEITFNIPIPPSQIAMQDICSLQMQIDTNAADIATNAADIATNAADIATNAADIANVLGLPDTYLSHVLIAGLK